MKKRNNFKSFHFQLLKLLQRGIIVRIVSLQLCSIMTGIRFVLFLISSNFHYRFQFTVINTSVCKHFCLQSNTLTLRWPMGGRGEVDATPTGFSNFFREWEEIFLQTKFLAVRSSLGHLSMRKFFRSDLPSWL